MEDTYIVLFCYKYHGELDAFSGYDGKGTDLKTAKENYSFCIEQGYENVRLLKYCEFEQPSNLGTKE